MTETDRPKGSPWLFPLLLAPSMAALFWGVLFRGESFFERDIQGFFRPLRALLLPLTRASSGLPLWNPLLASGQPFAANPQHELFHPLTALYFVLPFEWAFRLQTLLPVLVAAFSMVFLLRALDLHPDAAALGGLSWGIGGYTLSTTLLPPILLAIAVLPAVLAFAVRVAAGGGRANVAGLAVSLGLECLAGEPSTLVMTAVLLPVSLAHLSPRGGGPGFRRGPLFLLLGGLCLGAAIGAAALLPGLHHAMKTVRASGLDEASASAWSFPPVRFLELLFPRLLGHLDQADERWYWGRSLYPGKGYPYLYSIYPGLLVALLAGITAVRGSRRRWGWVAGMALGGLMAVGTHLPIWHLARSLAPVLRGIRYPEKFVLLVVLSATVMACCGLDEVLRGGEAPRRLLSRSLVAVALVSTGWGLVLLVLETGPGSALFEGWGIPSALAPLWAAVAARDAVTTGAVAVALLAALRLGRRGVWLLAAVTAVDLSLAGKALVPTKPAASLSTPPPFLRPLLRSKPPGLLFHHAAWDPRFSSTTGICSPPSPCQWGIPTTLSPDFDLTELRWSSRATRLFFEATRSDPSLFAPLLVRRGVSAVLRFRPGLTGEVGDRLAAGPEGPLQLLKVTDPAPLVFCASTLVAADGEKGWLAAVERLGKESATAAVVDRRDLAAVPDRLSPGRIENVVASPGALSFDVSAGGPFQAFVAINQTWDDGWAASVDGSPVPLVRTDVSLSGLLVTPGPHRVSLSYSDRWVTLGLSISSLALVASLVLLATASARPFAPRAPQK